MNGYTMKIGAACALVMTAVAGQCAETKAPLERLGNETEAEKTARMAWWTHDRFGMFIHFGLYALPARHEWIKAQEAISEEKYDEYFKRFDPDHFDAKAWAKWAKRAGMKYVVLTTKHHEGFCLWDTKLTDYKITNTPFKRDLVKEYVEACRAEGLKVGFYHSVIDWHHPDFTIDKIHPRKPWGGPQWATPPADAKEQLAKANEGRDIRRYQKYLHGQVEELLTNYGKIDIIWYDFTVQGEFGKTWEDWDAKNLIKLTRRLQPGILINDRLALDKITEDGWDFTCPEQVASEKWAEKDGKRVPWETCQTFSGSWGYFRDEASWKTPRQLIELLVKTVAHGGNLIMNVGPTGRGDFDDRAQNALSVYEKWMYANDRSIYGCTEAPAEFVAPKDTVLTYNPETRRLYLHILNWSAFGGPKIDFADKVAYAQLLNDASEVKVEGGALKLPFHQPDQIIPVVELYLK